MNWVSCIYQHRQFWQNYRWDGSVQSLFCETVCACVHMCVVHVCMYVCIYVYRRNVQGGSNMTGTNCDLFTHKSSWSYLNHLELQGWADWKALCFKYLSFTDEFCKLFDTPVYISCHQVTQLHKTPTFHKCTIRIKLQFKKTVSNMQVI
jgi:hypothetical protein